MKKRAKRRARIEIERKTVEWSVYCCITYLSAIRFVLPDDCVASFTSNDTDMCAACQRSARFPLSYRLLYGHAIKTVRFEQTMLNTLWNFADVTTARYWRALLLCFPSRYYAERWNCNSCKSAFTANNSCGFKARGFYVPAASRSAIDWHSFLSFSKSPRMLGN